MKIKAFTLLAAMLLATASTNAQGSKTITVSEPEFINSYCILTSDYTFNILPKENGTIKKHQNKMSKFSKILGHASTLASAGGAIGAVTSNSLVGAITGLKVMGTASAVGNAAGAVGGLTGAEGMDIAFDGGSSEYKVKNPNGDIRLLIKAENNDIDPMEIYRIVKFKKTKKDRRIQWLEIKPALIGSSDSEKSGYIGFNASKYGEKSYLLTIPADKAEKGEYGIFFMSIITSTAIPVGTFSVE